MQGTCKVGTSFSKQSFSTTLNDYLTPLGCYGSSKGWEHHEQSGAVDLIFFSHIFSQLSILTLSSVIQKFSSFLGIMATATHSHDGSASHSHNGFSAIEHGHSHEILDGPGSYINREMPIAEGRDWHDRAFTIGIGG